MEKLYLGIAGKVVCINKHNGDVIWDTHLKTSTVTNVFLEHDNIYAYAGGHLYCLEARNGEIKWENPMKGFGYGPCIMASPQQNAAVVSSQIEAQQAAMIASTAAATSANSSSS